MRYLCDLVTQMQLSDIPLKQGEPLCRHTSFQIGGPAACMAFPASAAQLRTIFALASEYGIEPIVLGAGTNVLAPDQGLDALVVETRTGMTKLSDLGDGVIEAECGVTLARLATYAMERSLTGLEFAHGIPGTVGGGIYMNAGAYGGEICQVLESVTVLRRNGSIQELSAHDLDLSYRHSCLMDTGMTVISARFRLQPGDKDMIRAKMAELMSRRRASQPLEFPSAGSTFKRPATGYAAALIEQCGLKGFTVGGAQVSKKHAGFVINTGHATAGDVLSLMDQVRAEVLSQTGIELEPEVRIMEAKR